MTHYFQTAAGLVLALLISASAQAATLVSETFDTDPIAGGRAAVSGSAARFAFTPGGIIAHYDTLLPTARLQWSLGQTLNQTTDFSYQATFTIASLGYLAPSDQFGQIAFGLINSSTTGINRAGDAGGGAYDIVTVDYFPNISPFFSSPTLSPTVIESNDGSNNIFSRIRFPQGDESALGEPGESELPRDVTLTAQVTYTAADRRIVMRLLNANGTPRYINDGGGLDGDTTTIQNTLPVGAVFSVDSFAFTLWNDPFSSPTVSSAKADLTFDSFSVTAVPEPSTLILALFGLGIVGLNWSRQRRIKQRA